MHAVPSRAGPTTVLPTPAMFGSRRSIQVGPAKEAPEDAPAAAEGGDDRMSAAVPAEGGKKLQTSATFAAPPHIPYMLQLKRAVEVVTTGGGFWVSVLDAQVRAAKHTSAHVLDRLW